MVYVPLKITSWFVVCGKPHNVQITNGLLPSSRVAHRLMPKRVSGVQKLAKNLKTSSKEAKRQRHSDKQGEKEGVDQ